MQIESFKYQASTKFIAGPGTLERLGPEVAALGLDNVLVVTDRGIVEAGLLESVLAPLQEAAVETAVFARVSPNPTDQTATEGAQAARKSGAQAVIGLGGGSPMDAAKAIAVLATNPGPLEEYCGAGADPWPHPPLPVLAVPTTAGTGAEVSAAAMINLPDMGRKVDLFGPSILPRLAIADANLTVSLPPRLTAWTGIDALSHAVEAYVCVGANPVSDALAEGAILLVAQHLRRAFRDGGDIEARHNLLVASAMAVLAASGAAGLGVIHSLAQTIGGFYDLPHGLTIAVCFPIGMAFNLPAVPRKFARVAALLGADRPDMTPAAAAAAALAAIRQLIADLRVEDTCESLGVRPEDLPKLAEYALLDGCTPTNPRPLKQEDFLDLFLAGFQESPHGFIETHSA